MCTRFTLVIASFVFVLMTSPTSAHDAHIGEAVILQGGSSNGIALHRAPRSSRFGFAEPGTTGEVLQTEQDGKWLFLSLESARAWVLARHTRASLPTTPEPVSGEIDRTKLLDTDCSGVEQRAMQNDLFTICHDINWRIPYWVGYRMFGDELDGPGDRHRSPWITDDRVAVDGQGNNRIYVGSGYHKGHLAPAQAYVKTQAAVDGTHIFTNAIPQFGSVNSGAWSKLEAAVRVAAISGADLWIITGSLFVDIDPKCQRNRPPEHCLLVDTTLEAIDPAKRMRDEIAVPSHTFKAVLAVEGREWSSRAFIMPNIPRGVGQFRNYRFSVDQLEHMLGIDLFQALPDHIEDRIEERATPLMN